MSEPSYVRNYAFAVEYVVCKPLP